MEVSKYTKNIGYKKNLNQKGILGLEKFWVQNVSMKIKKNLISKRIFCMKKILGLKINFGPKELLEQ